MAGISTGNKHVVNLGKAPKNDFPFLQCEFDCCRIGVVFIHRGIPDPDVQSILVRQARHADHRFEWSGGKMGAIGVVVRARRYQLNRIGTKHGQVAIGLLPLSQIPTIVGVCLGAISELMTSQ